MSFLRRRQPAQPPSPTGVKSVTNGPSPTEDVESYIITFNDGTVLHLTHTPRARTNPATLVSLRLASNQDQTILFAQGPGRRQYPIDHPSLARPYLQVAVGHARVIPIAGFIQPILDRVSRLSSPSN